MQCTTAAACIFEGVEECVGSRMKQIVFTASLAEQARRLDVVVAEKLTELSRAQVQSAVRQSRVLVDNRTRKASYRLTEGERVTVFLSDPVVSKAQPENIPLDIMYEDASVIVINKPAGMVVHPACGNYSGTLVNALLYRCKDLSGIGGVLRPGIVHRLDKGTTGVLVAAKNDISHRCLSEQFKRHSVVRQYSALVCGVMDEAEGTIACPIGRHPTDRKIMSTRALKGRPAETHWIVTEVLPDCCMLKVTLETGRTHQVRVHLASRGHPVAGDHVYGFTKRYRQIATKKVLDIMKGIKRPMLHAGLLEFEHPVTGRHMVFSVPLPNDFIEVVDALRGVR